MRRTYVTKHFDFGGAPTAAQTPRRVIIHRQGNPGAKALASLEWGKRTGAFTIHTYIGGSVCYEAIPATRHAFHVSEPRVAQRKGWRWTGAYGSRGDYDTIGIETEDVKGGAPRQEYSLTQDTRQTLVLRVADYLREFPHITPDDIYEHAELDPWQRAFDLGNALNINDFRDDVRDALAGRTPWRTVQAQATGAKAPVAWKVEDVTKEELSPPLTYVQRIMLQSLGPFLGGNVRADRLPREDGKKAYKLTVGG